MADRVLKLGRSVIQHGVENDRIYLMKLHRGDLPELLAKLDALALQRDYTKIFAKIPVCATPLFRRHGYKVEGGVPLFFKDGSDAAFLGKFIDPDRAVAPDRARLETIIEQATAHERTVRPVDPAYRLREADEDDVAALAALYGTVFESYPFPVHDPAYLHETMRRNVCYFVAEHADGIVAAASGEMDRDNRNAEMTDFATLPSHRGRGLATALLQAMEPVMTDRDIRTRYTIARARSVGMNITFARCGYTYGGTLINNTQIAGDIESMNLWYQANE